MPPASQKKRHFWSCAREHGTHKHWQTPFKKWRPIFGEFIYLFPEGPIADSISTQCGCKTYKQVCGGCERGAAVAPAQKREPWSM